MSAQVEILFDRHQFARDDYEYKVFAEHVIKSAFADLAECERWVDAHRSRLKAMPKAMFRGPEWRKLAYELDKRVKSITEDCEWFTDPESNYSAWSYWLDVHPDVSANEYRRRAGNLIDDVRAILDGAVA